MKKITRNKQRMQRRKRVRVHISGTKDRPRLNVFRSLRGLYLQLIDDSTGKTIVSLSSTKEKVKGDAGERKGNVATSYLLGKVLADKAKAAGINSIVFDRAGYAFHGKVKAIADGARDGGLIF